MIDFLAHFREVAEDSRATLPTEAQRIRGIWRTNYVLRLTEQETVLHLNYILVQTVDQGCCYFEAAQEDPGISEDLLGADAFEIAQTGHRSRQIAALDALFGAFKPPPTETHQIVGYNFEKADMRAALLCEEALTLARKQTGGRKRKVRIVNVGVIGSVLGRLAGNSHVIASASDYYQGIAGKSAHGVRVAFGAETLDLVGKADVAIVTGMTLANKTLDSIFEAAKGNGVGVILFAETGSHFGAEYCNLGVDVVVSEPYPFYLTCKGPTTIDIYRRRSGRQ